MIIYKDLISDDEIISDTWKLKEVEGVVYEVEGKFVKKSSDENFDIGANPSAEGGDDEGVDASQAVQVIDIVDAFRLQDMGKYDKKQYTLAIKDYMKNLVKKMKDDGTPDSDITDFKKKAQAYLPKILATIKDKDVYVGESMNTDGMLILLDYRPDGTTPYLTIWKHGLKEEKV